VALVALRRRWWHLVGQIQRRVEKRQGAAWK